MKKIKVMQQALDPNGLGGVSAEFRALKESGLGNEFEFIPLILRDYHKGLSLKDICFYYKRIKEEKPDIVQIRGAAIDGLNAEIAAKLVRKTKILLCIHGMYSDFVYYNSIKHLLARYIIEPICFFLADGISCVYKTCEKRNNFKLFRKKIVPFVYNRMPDYSAVDVDKSREEIRRQYSIPLNATVGIFCGRITKEKGLTYLAEALLSLADNWNDKLHILIVGDGIFMIEFQNILKSKDSLKNYIHFTGVKKNIAPMLAASDFFIMPSLHENHSIALLEAIAMKLPCIATDVGGNKEIVKDQKFGFVISPYNAKEIEYAINRMCDKECRNLFVKNIKAYEFVEFGNEYVDRQLRNAYMHLLKK